MPAWSEFGKVLIGVGVVLILVGVVFLFSGRLPFGRMPGDLVIERKNFSLAFPITTCIVISLVLTVIGWLISRWRS